VRRHLGGDVGSLERGILVLRAYGASARGTARRLVRRRHRDGSFDAQVNHTAFAVLALRAAGRSRRDRVVRAAVRWLGRQGNRDGGFNPFGRGGPSDVDDTAAVVEALVSAGRRRGPTVRRAVSFLARHQNRDGAFPLQPGQGSNAQSTAWAVQALVAARHGVRRPLAYLRGLTQRSGAVRYSRTSTQTPVWVTGEALMALARRPLPLHR